MSKAAHIVIDMPHSLMSDEQRIEGFASTEKTFSYYKQLEKDYLMIWNKMRDLAHEKDNNLIKIYSLATILKDINLRMKPLTEWAILRSDQLKERKEKFETVMASLEELGCVFTPAEHHPNNKK